MIKYRAQRTTFGRFSNLSNSLKRVKVKKKKRRDLTFMELARLNMKKDYEKTMKERLGSQ